MRALIQQLREEEIFKPADAAEVKRRWETSPTFSVIYMGDRHPGVASNFVRNKRYQAREDPSIDRMLILKNDLGTEVTMPSSDFDISTPCDRCGKEIFLEHSPEFDVCTECGNHICSDCSVPGPDGDLMCRAHRDEAVKEAEIFKPASEEELEQRGGYTPWNMGYWWNREYRHYLRSATPRQLKRVYKAFQRSNLPLNGASPDHTWIVLRTIKPEELNLTTAELKDAWGKIRPYYDVEPKDRDPFAGYHKYIKEGEDIFKGASKEELQKRRGVTDFPSAVAKARRIEKHTWSGEVHSYDKGLSQLSTAVNDNNRQEIVDTLAQLWRSAENYFLAWPDEADNDRLKDATRSIQDFVYLTPEELKDLGEQLDSMGI